LKAVKEALGKYNIFDDEQADLENSSVNSAFGKIAGGALAPSVAVFPLMFPEAQGWLSLREKLGRSNVWVSIGKSYSNSKTADYMIGYRTVPVQQQPQQPQANPSSPSSSTTTSTSSSSPSNSSSSLTTSSSSKKSSKPSVSFYILMREIVSVQHKRDDSCSFVVCLRDKTKVQFTAGTPAEAVSYSVAYERERKTITDLSNYQQAWSRLIFGSSLARRDWNAEFQALVDKGLGLREGEATRDRQEAINESFGKLVREFTALAEVLATVIVSERWLDDSSNKRLIPPIADSGAGGQKFLTHNIFVKFAIMLDECDYYHGEEEQAKAAELELKSLNAYMHASLTSSSSSSSSSLMSKVRFPLISMFDYRGLRLTATACLPLKEIIYGSADRAQTLHASVPEFNQIMSELGHHFNLKPHLVFSKKAHEVAREHRRNNTKLPLTYAQPPYAAELSTCGDVEGHLGTDQHYYLLDTARLFPPAAWKMEGTKNSSLHNSGSKSLYFPLIRGTFLCRMLRPEYLQRWKKSSISSDALSRWGENLLDSNAEIQNNRDAIEATVALEHETIPEAAAALEKTYGTLLSEASVKTFHIDGALMLREIIVDLHGRGINIRYLGLLRSHLKPTSPSMRGNNSTTALSLRSLVLTEMVMRVVKSWMNAQMRALQTTDFIAHQELVCDLFNQIFVNSTSEFWSQYLIPQMKHKFGPMALSSPDPIGDFQWIKQQVHWSVLFDRIQYATQILWREDAKRKIEQQQQQPSRKEDLKLVEYDILSVSPKAKHLFLVAKQTASYAQLRNTPQEGSALVRVKLGPTILNIRPQWQHVLNKWLEAIERYPCDGEAICSWAEAHTNYKLYLLREGQKETMSKTGSAVESSDMMRPYSISFAKEPDELAAAVIRRSSVATIYWSPAVLLVEERMDNMFLRDSARY